MFRQIYPKLACIALFLSICGSWAVVTTFAGQPASSPVAPVHPTAQRSCCSGVGSAPLLYCPLSDTVNAACCCDRVNGKWVCRHTGAVLDECCCIPIDD
jgi:hypothetical protein